jgi:hypothetical protein
MFQMGLATHLPWYGIDARAERKEEENIEEDPVRHCGPLITGHFQVAPWHHPFGDTKGDSFSLYNEKRKTEENQNEKIPD